MQNTTPAPSLTATAILACNVVRLFLFFFARRQIQPKQIAKYFLFTFHNRRVRISTRHWLTQPVNYMKITLVIQFGGRRAGEDKMKKMKKLSSYFPRRLRVLCRCRFQGSRLTLFDVFDPAEVLCGSQETMTSMSFPLLFPFYICCNSPTTMAAAASGSDCEREREERAPPFEHKLFVSTMRFKRRTLSECSVARQMVAKPCACQMEKRRNDNATNSI